MSGRLLIGTSGWSYKHWVELFYPPGVKPPGWLPYYSRFFNTVEVNNTFYRLPEKRVFEKWKEATPEGFAFTLKASRQFTHLHRLEQAEAHLGPFLENASGLGEKFKILLIQLPPGFQVVPGRLEKVFRYLAEQKACPGVQTALEMRDRSWHRKDILEMMRVYQCALVQADWPGFTNDGPPTAELVYLRRHGPGTLYASDYTEGTLQGEAEKVRGWLGAGKQVAVYYNNDAGGFAVKDAGRMREILEGESRPLSLTGELRAPHPLPDTGRGA